MAKARTAKKKVVQSEKALSTLVDKRIATLLGVKAGGVKGLQKGSGVMATPSVLSIVRATAYAHC